MQNHIHHAWWVDESKETDRLSVNRVHFSTSWMKCGDHGRVPGVWLNLHWAFRLWMSCSYLCKLCPLPYCRNGISTEWANEPSFPFSTPSYLFLTYARKWRGISGARLSVPVMCSCFPSLLLQFWLVETSRGQVVDALSQYGNFLIGACWESRPSKMLVLGTIMDSAGGLWCEDSK